MITTTKFQNTMRVLLGLMLLFTGTGHLTYARTEFLAQVPPWVPVSPALTVLLSGIAELALGLSLVCLAKQKVWVGWMTAFFFLAIFSHYNHLLICPG